MKIFRTGAILILLSVVLVIAGGALGGRGGMQIALVIAVVMNFVSYFFSDKIALRSSGAQPVSREQLPRLYQVMERLAAKANIPVPKLYVVPDAAPNAFATGRSPNHASVAVTQGLLQLMNDDELEGVIAHELSHVRNYDILTSSIAATIAGAITYLAQMGQWAMLFGGYGGRDDDREGGGFTALLMIFLAPFAALLLQLFLSRTREYSADETGVRMVGQPFGLISALEKLGAYNKRIPTSVISPSTSSLCIVKPLFGSGTLSSLFSTHPPLEDRIAALKQMVVTPLR
ncbi:MAG TPA: zinc metalloprotease HtpX [Candidatus Eremiobacteraceae bacterium]|nr:zinc metalloprotease HtpX [Candidatus Eremiobacteraceae bacterium]